VREHVDSVKTHVLLDIWLVDLVDVVDQTAKRVMELAELRNLKILFYLVNVFLDKIDGLFDQIVTLAIQTNVQKLVECANFNILLAPRSVYKHVCEYQFLLWNTFCLLFKQCINAVTNVLYEFSYVFIRSYIFLTKLISYNQIYWISKEFYIFRYKFATS